MHLTQDPHVETTHKTRYQKKPSSGAALCGVVTGPLGGLRRDVRRSPDSQDAHAVGLNHRRSRCETAKHARVNPHSKVRQAWIVSGATQNFDTYVYLTHLIISVCRRRRGTTRDTSYLHCANTDNGPKQAGGVIWAGVRSDISKADL